LTTFNRGHGYSFKALTSPTLRMRRSPPQCRIEQLVDLLHDQNSVGADRVVSSRPGIDIRGKSLRHLESANSIAACIAHIVAILLGKVGHASNPPADELTPCHVSRFLLQAI
jgi:hypothetical protein